MEYFDFEQAAREDNVASGFPEIHQTEAVADYDALFFDKNFTLPTDPPKLQAEKDVEPSPRISDNGVYPMYRAKEPCDLCRGKGLDCFIAQRGVMQNGCTCCISLYRECSFTHAKPQGKFLKTLHVVSEDAYVPTGSLTGLKVLKSLGGGNSGGGTGGGGGNVFGGDVRQRKSGARFPREATKILKAWISEHSSHPYPTDEEKDTLKLQTGLKRSQICNWLANARRRGKVRPAIRGSSPVSRPVNIPGKKLALGVDISDLTPLERWKHSPPEHEAASATDIIRAMAATPFSPAKSVSQSSHVRSFSRKTGSSNGDSSFSNIVPAPSVSSYSMDTKSSMSDMSFASAFSHRSSRASFNSLDRRERRRRRHKSRVGQNPLQQKSRCSRIFQCTFCTDSFPTKYDWQRHEKSLHVALDKWTCAPHGGLLSTNGKTMCSFCRFLDPDGDHLESHNYGTCQEKTIQERTFYRKDHLNQHLRLMHGVRFGPWMEQWESTAAEVKSRCGFCSAIFMTWKDRVDHLAAHFKNGANMSQWKGDWGFEPSLERLVENAMPPYLIGHERKTPNPWVAPTPRLPSSPVTGIPAHATSSSPPLNISEDTSCFRRLELALSAFIRRHVGRGVIPTDKMIQDEGRIIIYGTDDPWNQTCADNPIWLAMLKRDNGLCNIPDADNIELDDLGTHPPFAADGGLRQTPTHCIGLAAQPPLSPMFPSSALSSSGFQSPAFQSTGVQSGVPSTHGSFVGSVAGSIDVSSALTGRGLVAGRPSATSDQLSSSAPASARIDPQVQIAFGGKFDRLNNGYSDLEHDVGEMQFDVFEVGSGIIRNSLTGPPIPIPAPSPSALLSCRPLFGPFDTGSNNTFNSPGKERFSGSGNFDINWSHNDKRI